MQHLFRGKCHSYLGEYIYNLQGGTPSSGTGPSQANGGYQFFFIETSSPRVQADKAVLVNNVVTLTSKYMSMYKQ